MCFLLVVCLPAVGWSYFDGLLAEGISSYFLPLDDITEAVLLGPTLHARTVFIVGVAVLGLQLAGEGGLLVRVLVHDLFSFV